EGNIYLSDKDIIELSGISEDDKYLLVFPKAKERKLLKSPYIEEATVRLLDDRLIQISVKEVKQVAYLYEDGESRILLINGERIKLDSDNSYLIEKLPLLEGYDKEQISEILRGFKLIEYGTINEISEIHRYPFSYDANMMEVIMRDGNFCFVSWTGLSMLDEYYRIVSGLDPSLGNVCIYLDELTKSGYTSICPWQEQANEAVNSAEQ
ncbi:MAG: FtsQ-type POTRA domain-containing protein, partial [Erysipelotrichaceae bacterium]|nr:FtsQ-type POTRA domain-containing protein [Erysipelotrichaceae bacterium]